MAGHPNSWRSYEQCLQANDWRRLIWTVARFYHQREGQAFTDRQVKETLVAFRLILVDDMNTVRPKITRLIDEGYLVEQGDVLDAETRRRVRRVTWSPHAVEPVQERQPELFSV